MPPPMPSTTDDTTTIPRASLFEIFWLFNCISSMSFGGGVTAWIYREVVEQKKWLSQADFLSALTLAQVLPGINTANLAIYTGQRLRGFPGAAAAFLGLITVPFFAVLALAAIYSTIQSVPSAQHVLSGIAAAAVGLLMSVGIKAIRSARNAAALIVIGLLVLLVGVLQWPMIPVVLCIAPISVWIAWQEPTPKDDGDDQEPMSTLPAAPHA